jgi:hypothetical protein
VARFGASRWAVGVAVAVGALLVAGFSSSGTSIAAPRTGPTSRSAATRFEVRVPEISQPSAEGNGINRPQPNPPLPPGYTENEFFVGGTATRFTAGKTPNNGFWTATPGATAHYRTRVIVRQPPANQFSGTVIVEWFNVSSVEADPDWAYLSEQIGRDGDAYIGVSAQRQGVEGGKTLLNTDVNQQTASSLAQSGNVDKSGLKHIDPTRYGSLVHPGDAYSYDIFSQVGRAAADSRGLLLGGLHPKKVLAVGESQSAVFLTTYVDAVHPLDPVFDGFLIHSRGATGAPLDGKFDTKSRSSSLTRDHLLIRTDLEVPVFMFETETDLTFLGYSRARQPDSKFVHTWEVAGTSHADAHLLHVVIGGPAHDPSVGSLLGCTTPINTGPQHEVLQAALHHVVGWAGGGAPPPPGAHLQVVQPTGKAATIARDSDGNALGGVRNPLVDVPVAAYTGVPPSGTTTKDLLTKANGTCILFGQTTLFDQAKLAKLYGTADGYLAAFRTSADKEVAAGFLLRPDADALIAYAEANRTSFP